MRRISFVGLSALLLLVGASPAGHPNGQPFRGVVFATWDNVFLALVAPPAHFTGRDRKSTRLNSSH